MRINFNQDFDIEKDVTNVELIQSKFLLENSKYKIVNEVLLSINDKSNKEEFIIELDDNYEINNCHHFDVENVSCYKRDNILTINGNLILKVCLYSYLKVYHLW
jgi:hypothetical protein